MISVVLLMAGRGQRMKKNINKALLKVEDKPIFTYPLKTFKSFNFELILVVSKDNYDEISNMNLENVKLVIGGETRQESVYNGLKAATGDYILVHDAARAFIDKTTIEKIIELKNNNEAILTYLNVKDTIKIKDNDKYKTLKRDDLIAASTPQCASKEIFLEVYEKAKLDNFQATDDISLIEKYRPDIKINYILANDESFKITTPIDYELAKIIGRNFK
jgi:2-C-methyl-D-erythritol 4-phosphate cytidylyltransferase